MGGSYKNSLIGEVPSEWDEVLLGEIFEETNDRTSDRHENELYSLTIESGVVPKSERYEREFLTTKENDNYKIVQPGDFVYNPMNLRFGAIAKYNGHKPICVSGYYNIFRVKNDFNPDFVEQYLKSKPFINLYNRISTGTLVEKRRVHFLNFIIQNIPFPSIEEQKQIFEILNTTDMAISDIDEQIKDLTKLKKALARKLLTEGINHNEFQESQIGIIPVEWFLQKVEDVFNVLDSKRKPVKKSDRNNTQGIYPYYGASGIIDYVDDYIFDGEYVLLGEDGENINSRNLPLAFIVRGKVWVNNHAHILEISDNEKYDIRYLCHQLEFNDYSKIVKGSAQPKITQKDMNQILIPIPSLTEQKRIADILSSLEETVNQYKSQKSDYTQLKDGLMQQLLTGKIRVKVD